MSLVKKYPITFSLILIIAIILLNKIPLSDYLHNNYNFSEFYSERIENVILNSIAISIIIYLIKVNGIFCSFFGSVINSSIIYFVPLVLYMYVFSGGFSDFIKIDFSSIPYSQIIVYTLETFSAAFLEEFLFRGFILGLLLSKYFDSKNAILKSVLFSSLFFGFIHIINIWSQDYEISMKGVFNQIYAVSSIGMMYGATYLKTRNLSLLIIFHFLSNFFADIVSLDNAKIIMDSLDTIAKEKTVIESIISEILRLIIFGIPLCIGLFIINRISTEEAEEIVTSANKS